MYCRNCGAIMNPGEPNCMNCGAPVNMGRSFCPVCGARTPENAMGCLNCGTPFTTMVDPSMQKSKIAAGILGIFLGSLGIHNFYLGYTGKGIAQLLLTVLSCGALSMISGIWGFIEGIMLLTGSSKFDANGIPLKE